jgi:hypothetical protein
MTNYIPLRAVLNRVPKGVREEQSDAQLLMYALDAVRDLELEAFFSNDVQLVPINNHKVDVPEGTRKINMVTYMCTKPTDDETTDLLCTDDTTCACGTKISCGKPGIYYTNDLTAYCGDCDNCITESEDFETRTNNICRHTINYQLFLHSQYYDNNFMPLKYVGNANGLLHKCCPNKQCDVVETFSVNPMTNQLTTSLESGWVCLNREIQAQDTEGNILIPDESKLKLGLSFYIQAMHWNERDSWKEEGAMRRFESFLQKAEITLRSAKANLLAAKLDDNSIRKVMFTDTVNQKIMRFPARYFNNRFLDYYG